MSIFYYKLNCCKLSVRTLAIIEFLIKDARLEINSKDISGNTGFHLACKHGYLAIIDFLIKDARLKINAGNMYGRTGFHLACMYSKVAIVKILLENAYF